MPGGHYQIVTGGNALGYMTHHHTLPGGQYATGQVFILVYRLAMDAKTLQGDGVGG